MSKAIKGTSVGLISNNKATAARLANLERTPSGINSIGMQYLRPAKKTGGPAPSDADYPAALLPAIGTLVYYTPTKRLYIRDAVGSWLSIGPFA